MNRILKIGLVLLLAGVGLRALAEEEAPDNSPLDELLAPMGGLKVDPERCLSLIRIDRTEIVNEQTILFYMKGDAVYVNYLPRRCPGLGRNKAFSYKTSLSQLCHVDFISVLDNFGGTYRRGVSCGLGQFYPIGPEGAALLREREKAGLFRDDSE